MSLLDLLSPPDDRLFRRDLLLGVAVAIVTNNQDPEGLGRVRLKFPWLSDEQESDWARIASPMAGAGRGLFLLPEMEDEVLVAFEHGDIGRPMVLGGLWNGKDQPPADNADGANNLRLIRSRSGHTVRLDDSEGAERIEIVDAGGNNRIVIDTAANRIAIDSAKDIALRAPQGKILLECLELEVKAGSTAKLGADGSFELSAGTTLTIKGRTVDIN
jgi:uncharacterized protein involved in type VI secretion and phage assembly